MNIEYVGIRHIKPYAKNAKKHDQRQIDNVAESIKQFGFAQPLVIDKDGELIIGHCRLEAAKKLGLAEVPVVRMDTLTEEQVKKLRLLDNKLNESEWDFPVLLDDVLDLDFSEFDIDFGLNTSDDSDGLLDNFTEADMSHDSSGYMDRDTFNMTFSFPIDLKETIEANVKMMTKAVANIAVAEFLRDYEKESDDNGD